MQTRIKGYTFTLSEPFQAGTVITKGEAQALNDLRVENIANNLRKLVNDELALLPEGTMIAQHRLDEIQARIGEYDRGYQFLEKHTPRDRPGDIEREARAIAQDRVEQQVRAAEASLSEEQLEAAVAEMEKLPSVREEARERVAARRRGLAESLADL